jgi:hypothetical protein
MKPTHPAAQALLAGLMQAHGERHGDEAMRKAGTWWPGLRRGSQAGMAVLRRVLEEASRPEWTRLEALPRPAPPQEEPRSWWRRRWR